MKAKTKKRKKVALRSETRKRILFLQRMIARHDLKWQEQYGPGVLGTFVGRKTTDATEIEQFSIVFRVLKKKKEPKSPIPKHLFFRDARKGKRVRVSTDVVESKPFKLHSLSAGGAIKDINYPEEPGTISFFCKDQQGRLFACSNAHVLAIPYMADGGFVPENGADPPYIRLKWGSEVVPGRLWRAVFGPVDAAIAWLPDGTSISTDIPGIGPLEGVDGPPDPSWMDPDYQVRMYGKGCKLLHGRVKADWMPDQIFHGKVMKNMIHFVWLDGEPGPGDSGGPVVDQFGQLIAIHVAGRDNHSLGCPILEIIKPKNLRVKVLDLNTPYP